MPAYAAPMQLERPARWFVTATFIGLSVAWLIWSLGGLNLSDSDAYRQAANRLIAGEDLYVQAETQDEAFRYAPWFAAAWVPINALPELVGDIAWFGLLLVASVVSVVPLARRPELAARLLALFGGTMLVWTAARGNVHPLVMVSLIHGIDRRSGPLWVAIAASLKAVPIFFALVYVVRREWWRAVAAVALTALLVAPMPLFGWEPGSTDPGESLSLWYLVSPVAFAVGAAAVLVAAGLAAWRAQRWTALAAGVAAILALPRLLLYDLTYLLVGADRNLDR
jgi:hypothetical protein